MSQTVNREIFDIVCVRDFLIPIRLLQSTIIISIKLSNELSVELWAPYRHLLNNKKSDSMQKKRCLDATDVNSGVYAHTHLEETAGCRSWDQVSLGLQGSIWTQGSGGG